MKNPILTFATLSLLIFTYCAPPVQQEGSSPEFAGLQDSITPLVNDYMQNFYASDNDAMVSVALFYAQDTTASLDTAFYFSNSSMHNPPDADTRFQIGSITKTFTAAIIAQLMIDGVVSLQDDAQYYLPDTIPLPRYAHGADTLQMTVGNLVTYTSGWNKPYAHQDSTTYAELFNWFRSVPKLPTPPGTYQYINTDFSTLGLIYSHHRYPTNRKFYNQIPVMLDSVCSALGMVLSSVNPDTLGSNIAPPYHDKEPSSYHFPSWPANFAAGGIYSSIGDMRTYLKANLGYNPVFSPQLLDSLQLLRASTGADSIGMGWFYSIDSAHIGTQPVCYYWKAGGTPSFKSYILFATFVDDSGETIKAGSVVLANNGNGKAGQLCKHIFQKMLDQSMQE